MDSATFRGFEVTVTDAPDPASLAISFADWVQGEAAALEEFRAPEPTTLEGRMARDARLMALLFDNGWTRWGWPPEVGGLGGGPLLRAAVYESLTAAHLPVPEQVLVLETLGPAITQFNPHLAAATMPRLLRGDEVWCQGFSEPDAGSDLASLRCRAVQEGEEFVVNGQKTWSSFGHLASRCALLVRTGPAESRHRGLTMLLVDTDTPGVTARPIRFAGGRNETGELFFDSVRVPASRVIGRVGGGWAVAMFLLQYERCMYGWIRQAWLHQELSKLSARLAKEPLVNARDHTQLAEAYLATFALRARCRRSLRILAAGNNPGPEISVDKLLLSRAEQTVLDARRDLEWPHLELSVDASAQTLRSEWFYSRAASIYGGAVEIQRSIVADHLLKLPKESEHGR